MLKPPSDHEPSPPALANVPWPPRDEAIREALLAAWSDGSWGRYEGPHTRQLIQRLAELHGVEHVTLTCSGTVAVELALRGLRIGPGDEVILAGYDFPGNFRAIEAIGARPVLVDIDPTTWSIDPDAMAAAGGPNVRAVIVSHLHGGLAPMRALTALAARHGLAIVEDACQAPGATVDGQPAGTWGDVGVLSFGGSKLLSAGRGGAILTRQAEVHQRIRVYSARGNEAFPLSELQAAVLLPQLDHLAERNQQRRRAAERLLSVTKRVGGLRGVAASGDGSAASFYKLAWLLEEPLRSVCPRDALLAAAQDRSLPLDRGFRGFGQRSARRCRRVGSLEHSQRAAEHTILLHHPVLLAEAVVLDQLAAAMCDLVERVSRRT
jgi:perosamine synthetase